MKTALVDGAEVAASAVIESSNATCSSCGRPVYVTATKDGFTHDAPPAPKVKKPFSKMPVSGRTHDLGEDEPPQPPNQKADA